MKIMATLLAAFFLAALGWNAESAEVNIEEQLAQVSGPQLVIWFFYDRDDNYFRDTFMEEARKDTDGAYGRSVRKIPFTFKALRKEWESRPVSSGTFYFTVFGKDKRSVLQSGKVSVDRQGQAVIDLKVSLPEVSTIRVSADKDMENIIPPSRRIMVRDAPPQYVNPGLGVSPQGLIRSNPLYLVFIQARPE